MLNGGCGLDVIMFAYVVNRLCESKQSKVYLPEHPFPHAEVYPSHLVCVIILII